MPIKLDTKVVKMSNNMADDIFGEPVVPTEPSTEPTGEKEEPKVPLSRLREEADKVKKLEKQLGTSGQEVKPLTEEGRQKDLAELREKLEMIEADKEVEEKKALEELDKKIGELKVIDPTLDEKALLDIIEKYGVDIDKSFKIYNDFKAGQAPIIKPKLPTAVKTSDEVKTEEFQPQKVKSTWDAVQEGLKKFGLK